MSVEVRNLIKSYGSQKAVNDISFEAKKGEIIGFLGPNGAGKSTTMKVITCYNPPTSGQVLVCGLDVEENSLAVREKIGYLPEHNPLYLEMYVREYLHLVASLHGIASKKRAERVNEMITLCGLTKEQNKKIGELSKGYRQRVGLAQALIHNPEVLILDEPTTGLDPNQLKEIRALIKNISRDKTVILSTHIMQEVQALCDRVVIIKNGVLVANDSVTSLTDEKQSEEIEILARFTSPIDLNILNAEENLTALPTDFENTYKISLPKEEIHRVEFIKLCVNQNLPLIDLHSNQKSIEEVFQSLTK